MGRGSGSSIAIPKQLWHGGLSQITIGRRDFDSDAIRAEFPKSTPLDPPMPQINPEEFYSHSRFRALWEAVLRAGDAAWPRDELMRNPLRMPINPTGPPKLSSKRMHDEADDGDVEGRSQKRPRSSARPRTVACGALLGRWVKPQEGDIVVFVAEVYGNIYFV